jgi:hypothetical protein
MTERPNASTPRNAQFVQKRQSKMQVSLGVISDCQVKKFSGAKSVKQGCFTGGVPNQATRAEAVLPGINVPNPNRARLRRGDADDALEQSRFASTIGPSNRDDLPGIDPQRHAPKDFMVAI